MPNLNGTVLSASFRTRDSLSELPTKYTQRDRSLTVFTGVTLINNSEREAEQGKHVKRMKETGKWNEPEYHSDTNVEMKNCASKLRITSTLVYLTSRVKFGLNDNRLGRAEKVPEVSKGTRIPEPPTGNALLGEYVKCFR